MIISKNAVKTRNFGMARSRQNDLSSLCIRTKGPKVGTTALDALCAATGSLFPGRAATFTAPILDQGMPLLPWCRCRAGMLGVCD